MSPSARPPRTAREIIDEAIADNRMSEYLAYCFATVFVLVGVVAIVWSMFTKQQFATLGAQLNQHFFGRR